MIRTAWTSRMPWYAKMAAKLALARLPVSPDRWHRLGLFQSGAMDDPAYALDVFAQHFARFLAAGRQAPFAALELGPGRSILSGLIAYAHGAERTYLIDVAPISTTDVTVYRRALEMLRARGLRTPPGGIDRGLPALMTECGIHYATDGLDALRAIPTGSIHFSWSQAVLEHVRKDEFTPIMRELYRTLTPGGISSHRVDLRDHLHSALENLRFPEALWESRLMAGSGFYTNRIRFGEMVRLCRDAGFHVDVVSTQRWPALPTPRARFRPPFRELPDDDLLVSGFDMTLTKPRS